MWASVPWPAERGAAAPWTLLEGSGWELMGLGHQSK